MEEMNSHGPTTVVSKGVDKIQKILSSKKEQQEENTIVEVEKSDVNNNNNNNNASILESTSPPQNSPSPTKKAPSRLSLWKNKKKQRKVSSKIYPEEFVKDEKPLPSIKQEEKKEEKPLPSIIKQEEKKEEKPLPSIKQEEIQTRTTLSPSSSSFNTPVPKKKIIKENVIDSDVKTNVETKTIIDNSNVKTTRKTIVTTTTTTTTTTTEHVVEHDTLLKENDGRQETEVTPRNNKSNRNGNEINKEARKKRSLGYIKRRKQRSMYGQILRMQKWRKYQCILVLLSWVVNIAQNTYAWHTNYTINAFDVQYVCSDFHSTNYHKSNCIDGDKIGIPRAYPIKYNLPTVNALRGAGTMLTFMIIYVVYKFQQEEIYYDKINHPEVTVHMNMFNSNRIIPFVIECMLTIGHVPPFIEEILAVIYSPDQQTPFMLVFLTSLPFIRFYVLFVYLYYLSDLHSQEGEFISKLTNLSFTSSSAYKFIYLWNPQLCLALLSSICMGVGGFIVYVSEGWYCAWKPEQYCKDLNGKIFKTPYLHILDAIWLKMLTLTAIGYGRITPATTVAKFACVVSAIVGRLSISAMTANVLQLTGLLELEERAHNYTIKCCRESAMQHTASRVIQACWRWYKVQKKSFKWNYETYKVINTDFQIKQTRIYHRESHAPFILRVKLFDRISQMRQARLKQRRRRIDHAGTIHELDMSRKANFILQETARKFVRSQHLITHVLGQKKSKDAFRGAIYVRTDVGPKWLNRVVKKIRHFGNVLDKKTEEVSMKRIALEYMGMLNQSRTGGSPSSAHANPVTSNGTSKKTLMRVE